MSLAETGDHRADGDSGLTHDEIDRLIVACVGAEPDRTFLCSELVRSVGEQHVFEVMLGVTRLFGSGRLERVRAGEYQLPKDSPSRTADLNRRRLWGRV